MTDTTCIACGTTDDLGREWHRSKAPTGSVKSQGALGVASSTGGRGAARDLSALSI